MSVWAGNQLWPSFSPWGSFLRAATFAPQLSTALPKFETIFTSLGRLWVSELAAHLVVFLLGPVLCPGWAHGSVPLGQKPKPCLFSMTGGDFWFYFQFIVQAR